MANRNKTKGKQFEERVAKFFRARWGLNKHECHRALSSGTYQVDYSDIVISPDNYKRPHIIIECKKRKVLPANQILIFTSEFKGWVKQVEEASKKYFEYFKIEPLRTIVFAVDRMNPLIIIPKEQFTPSFFLERNINLSKECNEFFYSIVYNDYIAVMLEEFLENTSLIPY